MTYQQLRVMWVTKSKRHTKVQEVLSQQKGHRLGDAGLANDHLFSVGIGDMVQRLKHDWRYGAVRVESQKTIVIVDSVANFLLTFSHCLVDWHSSVHVKCCHHIVLCTRDFLCSHLRLFQALRNVLRETVLLQVVQQSDRQPSLRETPDLIEDALAPDGLQSQLLLLLVVGEDCSQSRVHSGRHWPSCGALRPQKRKVA